MGDMRTSVSKTARMQTCMCANTLRVYAFTLPLHACTLLAPAYRQIIMVRKHGPGSTFCKSTAKLPLVKSKGETTERFTVLLPTSVWPPYLPRYVFPVIFYSLIAKGLLKSGAQIWFEKEETEKHLSK